MSDRVDTGISWSDARPDICDIRLFRSRTVLVLDADLLQSYGELSADLGPVFEKSLLSTCEGFNSTPPRRPVG